MPKYTVSWEMSGMEFDSPLEAALEYEQTLTDPERMRPIVTVRNEETGAVTEIDLEDN